MCTYVVIVGTIPGNRGKEEKSRLGKTPTFIDKPSILTALNKSNYKNTMHTNQ